MKYTILISSVLFFSCQKSDFKPDLHIVNQGKRLTLLTQATQQFGIIELEQVFQSENKVVYTFNGPKKGNFKYEQIGPDRIKLTLNNDTVPITLTLDRVDKTILYEEKGINLLDSSAPELSIEEQTQIALLVTLYRELTSPAVMNIFQPIGPRIPIIEDPRKVLVCTKTAASFRISESESIWRLNAFVDKYLASHPDCSRQYGVDTGCLWGSYGCVATQQLKCKCK